MRPVLPTILLALAGTTMVGCNNTSRALTLFSDTTVGIEITLDSESATPARAILGFHQSRGLKNPVVSNEVATDYREEGGLNNKTVTPRYRPEAYSVVVKENGYRDGENAELQAKKKISGRLFLMGKAADLLVQSPAAVATLTDDPAVAIEAIRAAAGVTQTAAIR